MRFSTQQITSIGRDWGADVLEDTPVPVSISASELDAKEMFSPLNISYFRESGDESPQPGFDVPLDPEALAFWSKLRKPDIVCLAFLTLKQLKEIKNDPRFATAGGLDDTISRQANYLR